MAVTGSTPISGSVTFAGTVLDSDGKPVWKATVIVTLTFNSGRVQTATGTVDENGNYSILYIVPGTETLVASGVSATILNLTTDEYAPAPAPINSISGANINIVGMVVQLPIRTNSWKIKGRIYNGAKVTKNLVNQAFTVVGYLLKRPDAANPPKLVDLSKCFIGPVKASISGNNDDGAGNIDFTYNGSGATANEGLLAIQLFPTISGKIWKVSGGTDQQFFRSRLAPSPYSSRQDNPGWDPGTTIVFDIPVSIVTPGNFEAT